MTSRLRVGDIVRLRNGRCTYTVTHVYPTYWNKKESVIVRSNNSGYVQKRRYSEDYTLILRVEDHRMRDIKKNTLTFKRHGWKPGDTVRLISKGNYEGIKLYEEFKLNSVCLISVYGIYLNGSGYDAEWERVKKAGEEDKKYVVRTINNTVYITGTIPSDVTEVYELGKKLSKKVEWV